jgi:hypothetical protein
MAWGQQALGRPGVEAGACGSAAVMTGEFRVESVSWSGRED